MLSSLTLFAPLVPFAWVPGPGSWTLGSQAPGHGPWTLGPSPRALGPSCYLQLTVTLLRVNIHVAGDIIMGNAVCVSASGL